MFFTGCILHNMSLKVDGYDVRWESDVNWAGQDGNHHDKDMSTLLENHCQRHRNATPYTEKNSTYL